MAWLKFTVAAGKGQLDHVSGCMNAAGAQAITIQDAGDSPLFDRLDGEMPVWDTSMVTGLFEADQQAEAVVSRLEKAFSPQPLPNYHIEELPEQDWERSWMERFQPMQYGDGLWICPTWSEPPDPAATNIMLDPGLAFGSGSHETTRMCLRWLASQDVSGKTVIDYGCGSGVLAIAALKLGATHAAGIDIDQQALKASRTNAETNHVSDRLELHQPADVAGLEKAGIVFANILAGTLVELKSELKSLCRDGGVLVLSGILQSQKKLIVDNYREPGFIIDIHEDGDWVMLTLQFRAAG
jgi:ribosomal protein L11 methyltransferase